MEAEDVVNGIQSAIEAHRTDIMKTMLETVKKGWSADKFNETLNRCGADGSFLHRVTREDKGDMVRLLLSYGADASLKDSEGRTASSLAASDAARAAYVDTLFASIAKDDKVVIRKLLHSGLDVDVRDNAVKHNTLLHWAVSFTNHEAVEYLAEQGATLDLPNAKGLTPLHEAAQAGNCDMVRLLLRHGADANFPVHGDGKLQGKTAAELTASESVVAILRAQKSEPSPSKRIPEVNGRPAAAGRPTSPSADSVFSLEEINSSIPALQVPVRPVITDARLHWLWPPPKEVRQLAGAPFELAPPWNVAFVGCAGPLLHRVLDIWDVHKPHLTALGVDPAIADATQSARLICCVNQRLFAGPEAYRITVAADRISMVCADTSGLHHALATLRQLIRLCQAEGLLPALHIDDRPSLRLRAILLDVTINGRVPLLDTLFSMVDVWHAVKINQLHLYTRVDTSALASQWPWPYTKTELLSLDRYCQDRGLELVPALEMNGGASFEPLTFQALLASARHCFPSTSYIHAGPQLTSMLMEMQDATWSFDLTWLLCANSLRSSPSAHVDPSAVLAEYGFQADYNFHEMSQPAWQGSSAMCFCGGTASWSCLAGYPDAAAANILHAVQAAVDRGSLGAIAATWTDAVALGSLHFAWPGWICHAGLSWNPSVHWDFIQNSLAELVSLWALDEAPAEDASGAESSTGAVGAALVELGRLETWMLRFSRGELDSDSLIEASSIPPSLPPRDGSTHYQLLVDTDNVCVDNLSMECVVRAVRHAKKWHNLLTGHQANGRAGVSQPLFARTAAAQCALTADFLLLAGRIGRGVLATGSNPSTTSGLATVNLGVANLSPTLRTDVANRLLSLTERFKQLWALQYQVPSSGLNNVLATLTTATKRLLNHPGHIGL